MRSGWTLLVLVAACGRLDSAPPCPSHVLAGLSNYESFDALALRGPDVLWTTSTGLWSLPKQGGAPTELASCGGTFAVDGETAYCIDFQSHDVLRVPLDGSGASTLATNVKGSIVSAADGRIFLGDGATLSTMDEVSGVVAQIASAPSLVAFAVDGGFVYWSSSSAGPQTTVNATSTTTGETTPLATLNIVVHFLAVNSKSLFVSGYNPNDLTHVPADTIFQMPRAGGTPHVFAAPTVQTAQFAVDDTTLFAATKELGLAAFPLDGGTPTKLGVGSIVSLIATDESSVYWAVNVEHAATLSRVCR